MDDRNLGLDVEPLFFATDSVGALNVIKIHYYLNVSGYH